MENKDTMTWSRLSFIASAMMVFALGLLLTIDASTWYEDFGILALLAIAALSLNFFHYTGQSGKYKDERRVGVANKAMALSWYSTLITVLAMLAVVSLGNFGLTAGQILGIGIMVMISTMVIYNEVVARRDVNNAASASAGRIDRD